MCDLKNRIEEKEVTGYKVVIEIDGKYYSLCTGVEYEVGLVKIPRVQKNYVPDVIINNLLKEGSIGYNENMIGRTCVFESILYAIRLQQECIESRKGKFPIIKMTLKNDLMSGTYDGDTVYGGRYIVSMEELGEN